VLNKLPGSSIIPQVLHDLFKESIFGSNNGLAKKCRRKRFNIEPGRSATEANMFNEEEVQDTEGYNEEELNPDTEINTNVTELNKNNENNYETEENGETVNINNIKIDDFAKVKSWSKRVAFLLVT